MTLTERIAQVPATKTRKVCCCCGGDAGKWEQWFNRDTGYGMCAKCIAWLRGRGTTETEIRDLYGIEGVNWGSEHDENCQRGASMNTCPACNG